MKRKAKRKKHDYETAYPEQCEEFRKIIDNLYQLFLDKGKEYGVNNVRAMGPLGLSLRMFEKVIRVLNLLGWNPWKGEFTKAINSPKFDSVEKECEDIANIAIISLILARGKWAK
jgi:hypothetical protein